MAQATCPGEGSCTEKNELQLMKLLILVQREIYLTDENVSFNAIKNLVRKDEIFDDEIDYENVRKFLTELCELNFLTECENCFSLGEKMRKKENTESDVALPPGWKLSCVTEKIYLLLPYVLYLGFQKKSKIDDVICFCLEHEDLKKEFQNDEQVLYTLNCAVSRKYLICMDGHYLSGPLMTLTRDRVTFPSTVEDEVGAFVLRGGGIVYPIDPKKSNEAGPSGERIDIEELPLKSPKRLKIQTLSERCKTSYTKIITTIAENNLEADTGESEEVVYSKLQAAETAIIDLFSCCMSAKRKSK